ncbi:MAG: hypothetical protein K2X86_11695 [Cytophagaceae bacterium]|nr:hypothetical protein [Cytophagaceae bacterium]
MAKKKPPPKPRRKKVTLREDTQLNQKIIDELEELFMMASPKTLMKSVNYIFYQYLFYADVDGYPSEFKHISEDFYFLQKFFAECSERFNEKP